MTDPALLKRLQGQWRKLEREKHKEDRAKVNENIHGKKEEAALSLINNPELASRSEWIEARGLYMRYVPMTRIAAETGIPIEEIKAAVFAPHVGWRKIRKDVMEEFNEEIKSTHLVALQKCLGVSLSLIARSLVSFEKKLDAEKKAKPNDPLAGEPSLYDAELIAKIFSRLHKAKVIENISDHDKLKLGMSPLEVMREIGKDPYLKKAIQMNNEVEKTDEMLEIEEESVAVVKNADSESLANPHR